MTGRERTNGANETNMRRRRVRRQLAASSVGIVTCGYCWESVIARGEPATYLETRDTGELVRHRHQPGAIATRVDAETARLALKIMRLSPSRCS